MAFSGRKSFIMITGASRGIGRAITFQFAHVSAPGSVLLLTARSEDALVEVKDRLGSEVPSVNVKILVADLSKMEDCNLGLEIENVLEESGGLSAFEQAIIVHNAGSIGDVSRRAVELENLSQSAEYYKLNVASPVFLNSAFFRVFNSSENMRRGVINISSLCGIEPFKSFSLYCSGKAARDMFFKVLALEEPDIDVLSYAPGPVDTKMVSEIIENCWNTSLVEFNTKMREDGAILSPEETSRKLVRILDEKNYKSGQHVDYYDVEDA